MGKSLEANLARQVLHKFYTAVIHFASSCMYVPKSFTEVLFSCPLSIKEKIFFRFTIQNPSDELSLPEELTLFSDLHSLQFSVPSFYVLLESCPLMSCYPSLCPPEHPCTFTDSVISSALWS